MIIQPDPSTVLPPGADPTNAMTASNPDFLSTLQSTMMNQSGMISSANTGLEQAIRGAIGKVAESTSKGSQVIESKYNREIDYTNTSQQNALTAVRERGAGISTGDIAYKALAAEADKNLKDLEQRKNELIMQNDAAGASKIADLMLTTQKMKIDAMQQTFQNLMSMGNFGLAAAQEKRAANAQTFAEKSAIASVGLQYGVPVTEKDTIATITAKAAPFASKKQAAELAKLVAETNRANAEANKAYNDNKLPNLKDPLLLSSASRLFRTNYADFVSKAKTPTEMATVQAQAIKDEGVDVANIIQNEIKNGNVDPNVIFPKVQAQLNAMGMPMIAAKEAMAQIESATKGLKAPTQTSKRGFASDVQGVFDAAYNTGYGFGSYLSR